MSVLLANFVVSLLAANSGRTYDWIRSKIEDMSRESDYSLDLSYIETEFQRALEDQIKEEATDELAEPLSEAIDPWDAFVHELYAIDSASPSADEFEEGSHDSFMTLTEDEAVNIIVDTWIKIAERDYEGTITRQSVRSIVIEAYNESVTQFHEEIAGKDIAHEVLLESVEDLRERLSSLSQNKSDLNVYKSRSEFENLSSLFNHQPEYVTVSAERETVDLNPENESIPVSDAKQELLRLLDNDIDLITVSGDGGIGKSRLLTAVGEELEKEGDCSVYYVTNPSDQKPLPNNCDTVLFVDDAGRKDMEYFLRKAIPEDRNESHRDHTVQVVAATRTVYEETLKQSLSGIGTIDKRTLWLDSLDESDIPQIIDYYDFSQDTTNKLVNQANGNPFFAILLAEITANNREDRPTVKDALEDVVGNMTSSEGDLKQVAEVNPVEAVEHWIEALALWQYYIEPDDKELIKRESSEFSGAITRRRQLDELADSGYLEKFDQSGSRSTKYYHRHDVIADYLRLEIIVSGQYYAYIQSETLSKRAADIAQGIAGLKASPLTEFYANASENMREMAEWLAEEILEADLPLYQIVEAESHLLRVDPEQVPYNDLLERITSSEGSRELGDSVAHFTGTVLSQMRHDETYNSDKWLSCMDDMHAREDIKTEKYSLILSHSIRKYGNLGKFTYLDWTVKKIRQLPEPSVHYEIAGGLANAVSIYAHSKKFSEVEDLLSDIRRLEKEYPESNVQQSLSMALMNAAAGYGEEEEFTKLENFLSEIRELHYEYPEPDVARMFGLGLANAAADYGEAKRFENVEEAISELRELHDEHPRTNIRKEVAVALYNAITNYGKAEKFDEMKSNLSHLQRFHEEYQEVSIREQLVDGYSEAAAHYTEVGHIDSAEEAASRLRELHSEYRETKIRESLGNALFNLVVGHQNNKNGASAEEVLSELQELHEEYSESDVRKSLTLGLVRRVGRLCEMRSWVEVDEKLSELRELHENYSEKETRNHLTTGLMYAIQMSINEKRFDKVEQFVDEVESLAAKHGDLGGFEKQKKFLQAYQRIVLRLLHHRPDSAITVVEIVNTLTEDVSRLQFQVKLGNYAKRLYDNKEITRETYMKLLDHT